MYSRDEPIRPLPAREPAPLPREALDFVRFCYRRRQVGWPELYDEMCAVAARRAFQGMGYAELIDSGISFSLDELPRLAAIADHVFREGGGQRVAPAPMLEERGGQLQRRRGRLQVSPAPGG